MDIKQLLSSMWKFPTIVFGLFLLGLLLLPIALIFITLSDRATENLSRIIREIRSPSQSNNSFDSSHMMTDQNQPHFDKKKESASNSIKGYRDQTQK